MAAALPERLADRTLQYRLKYLVDKGRLITEGEGRRWTRYRVPAPAAATEPRAAAAEKPVSVAAAAEKTEGGGGAAVCGQPGNARLFVSGVSNA